MKMKFKVWDSSNKIFRDDADGFYIGNDGILYEGFYYDGLSRAKDSDHTIFSTGQTDKNGVEIFVGDIIVHLDFDSKTFIIDFKKGCFGLSPIVSTIFYNSNINWYELEIIGNKYENPELLNGVE